MKQTWMGATVFALAASVLMISCSKQPLPEDAMMLTDNGSNLKADKANTFYGPQVHLGNGKARSFVVMDKSGKPLELGVEMTAGAMQGLPEDEHDFEAATFRLPLHYKAEQATAFDHVDINWNVQGHEPPGVFTIPHFDFHFYMITQGQQMAIPPYSVNPAGFDNLPAPASWPIAYVPTPGGVPQMGKHWVSTSFTPPFSHTMIYGSYAGQFIFVEPMITRQFLLAGTRVDVPYSPLRGFPVAGKWYPQTYHIYKEGGKHYVTLSNFSWH